MEFDVGIDGQQTRLLAARTRTAGAYDGVIAAPRLRIYGSLKRSSRTSVA